MNMREYDYANYTSQDLLQAGETNVSAGRATMLMLVLLGTHSMHHWLALEPG